jgi:hypothetical protein
MAEETAARIEDDDDPETFACYRHPDRQTALRCSNCDRPICVDCVVQGPVGIKCPDCARTSRAARGVVPTAKLVRGIVASAALALVLGVALTIVHIPFLGIILAYAAGSAVGEVARRASGGYRDPMLGRAAALACVVGLLLLPGLAIASGSSVNLQGLVWELIAAAFAAYAAFHRAS